MEPECGINCVSETLSEAKQEDIYCKLGAACLALVTARCVLWNVDLQSWDLSGTVAAASCVKSKLGLLEWGQGVGNGQPWTGEGALSFAQAPVGRPGGHGHAKNQAPCRRNRNFFQVLLFFFF